VRNENATRPWQHVLEPLSGYLLLGQKLWDRISAESLEQADFKQLASAFNFGPRRGSARTVRDLVTEVLRHWPGRWSAQADSVALHEAKYLSLAVDKAFRLLGWSPVWDFEKAVAETITWYKTAKSQNAMKLLKITQKQIADYTRDATIYWSSWDPKAH
jgi:CDP-glucose 4,6-dehydratase